MYPSTNAMTSKGGDYDSDLVRDQQPKEFESILNFLSGILRRSNDVKESVMAIEHALVPRMENNTKEQLSVPRPDQSGIVGTIRTLLVDIENNLVSTEISINHINKIV
jgi:hypothetical protein